MQDLIVIHISSDLEYNLIGSQCSDCIIGMIWSRNPTQLIRRAAEFYPRWSWLVSNYNIMYKTAVFHTQLGDKTQLSIRTILKKVFKQFCCYTYSMGNHSAQSFFTAGMSVGQRLRSCTWLRRPNVTECIVIDAAGSLTALGQCCHRTTSRDVWRPRATSTTFCNLHLQLIQ